jgi:hypothetical protein
MNQLYVRLQHSIATLAANGWSCRRIERAIDLTRQQSGLKARVIGLKRKRIADG